MEYTSECFRCSKTVQINHTPSSEEMSNPSPQGIVLCAKCSAERLESQQMITSAARSVVEFMFDTDRSVSRAIRTLSFSMVEFGDDCLGAFQQVYDFGRAVVTRDFRDKHEQNIDYLSLMLVYNQQLYKNSLLKDFCGDCLKIRYAPFKETIAFEFDSVFTGFADIAQHMLNHEQMNPYMPIMYILRPHCVSCPIGDKHCIWNILRMYTAQIIFEDQSEFRVVNGQRVWHQGWIEKQNASMWLSVKIKIGTIGQPCAYRDNNRLASFRICWKCRHIVAYWTNNAEIVNVEHLTLTCAHGDFKVFRKQGVSKTYADAVNSSRLLVSLERFYQIYDPKKTGRRPIRKGKNNSFIPDIDHIFPDNKLEIAKNWDCSYKPDFNSVLQFICKQMVSKHPLIPHAPYKFKFLNKRQEGVTMGAHSFPIMEKLKDKQILYLSKMKLLRCFKQVEISDVKIANPKFRTKYFYYGFDYEYKGITMVYFETEQHLYQMNPSHQYYLFGKNFFEMEECHTIYQQLIKYCGKPGGTIGLMRRCIVAGMLTKIHDAQFPFCNLANIFSGTVYKWNIVDSMNATSMLRILDKTEVFRCDPVTYVFFECLRNPNDLFGILGCPKLEHQYHQLWLDYYAGRPIDQFRYSEWRRVPYARMQSIDKYLTPYNIPHFDAKSNKRYVRLKGDNCITGEVWQQSLESLAKIIQPIRRAMGMLYKTFGDLVGKSLDVAYSFLPDRVKSMISEVKTIMVALGVTKEILKLILVLMIVKVIYKVYESVCSVQWEFSFMNWIFGLKGKDQIVCPSSTGDNCAMVDLAWIGSAISGLNMEKTSTFFKNCAQYRGLKMLFEDIKTYSSEIFYMCYYQMYGVDFIPKLAWRRKYNEAHHELLKWVSMTTESTARRIASDQAWCDKTIELIFNYCEYYTDCPREAFTSQEIKEFQYTHDRWIALYATIISGCPNSRSRTSPLNVIVATPDSRAGKDITALAIARILFEMEQDDNPDQRKEWSDSRIFQKPLGSAYWEGYQPGVTEAVLITEYLNTNNLQQAAEDSNSLLNVCDDKPMPLNMANVDMKGAMFAIHKMNFITTPITLENIDRYSELAQKFCVQKRMHVCIEPNLNPDRPEDWSFDVENIKYRVKVEFGTEKTKCKLRLYKQFQHLVGRDCSLMEICVVLYEEMKRMKTQKSISERAMDTYGKYKVMNKRGENCIFEWIYHLDLPFPGAVSAVGNYIGGFFSREIYYKTTFMTRMRELYNIDDPYYPICVLLKESPNSMDMGTRYWMNHASLFNNVVRGIFEWCDKPTNPIQIEMNFKFALYCFCLVKPHLEVQSASMGKVILGLSPEETWIGFSQKGYVAVTKLIPIYRKRFQYLNMPGPWNVQDWTARLIQRCFDHHFHDEVNLYALEKLRPENYYYYFFNTLPLDSNSLRESFIMCTDDNTRDWCLQGKFIDPKLSAYLYYTVDNFGNYCIADVPLNDEQLHESSKQVCHNSFMVQCYARNPYFIGPDPHNFKDTDYVGYCPEIEFHLETKSRGFETRNSKRVREHYRMKPLYNGSGIIIETIIEGMAMNSRYGFHKMNIEYRESEEWFHLYGLTDKVEDFCTWCTNHWDYVAAFGVTVAAISLVAWSLCGSSEPQVQDIPVSP